jgi:hypothetical protein
MLDRVDNRPDAVGLAMNRSERRLHTALSFALAAGLGATGCSKVTGKSPDNLEEVCGGDWRADLVFNTALDFYAQRYVESYEGVVARQDTQYATGVACATATDVETCLATLTDAWPTPANDSSCEYNLDGCWSFGVVTTIGDDVRLYQPVGDSVDLILPVESAGDALYAASAAGYGGECKTVVRNNSGAWRMAAIQSRGECPIIHHFFEIEVAEDGTTTVLREMGSEDTGVCVGRRPDGLHLATTQCDDAVGKHLAHMAWLEGAAIHAFERLVIDLEQHNAPADLITRAKRAVVDEIDHATRVGALAQRFGATIPDVVVAPHTARSLYDVALENAVEGCVRETYGVVDALFRSQQAQDAQVRQLFAGIAEDETRHAALSWDIAAWAETQLSNDESTRIQTAAIAAHDELGRQLRTGRPDVVRQQLGAPPAHAAVAMAHALRERLAA